MTDPGAATASGVGRVVLLLNNPFRSDSRTWKIARSLAGAGLRVTVVARAESESGSAPVRESRDGFDVLRVRRPAAPRWIPAPRLPSPGERPRSGSIGRLRDRVRDSVGRLLQGIRYVVLSRRWAAAIAAAAPDADVWQAEGLITLPVALRLRRRRGGRVVYDSRDVHVESVGFARLPGPWRRLLARRERAWARAADAVVTVSRPYADVLRTMLGVEPVIVMNGPVAWDPPDPPERLIHRRLGLPPDRRVVLHLGALTAHRGIEELCRAIGLVERADLVVVGDGPAEAGLRAMVADLPHAGRIHFLPAVPPGAIPALNAAADVAAIPVRGTTLNHRLNTPTKLFDAMGAGTPVVASDLPGLAAIVGETGCGVLCDPDDPADIARAIRDVIDGPADRVASFRAAALAAARGPYAWERQAEHLLGLYRSLGVPSTTVEEP